MTRLIFRDHLIYLFLITLLVFGGACFTENVMGYLEEALSLKIAAIPLLLINAFLIYFLILNYFRESFVAFSVSSLYLVAPTHFDIFVYSFQFQTLLAETCLLAFFLLYQISHIWKALVMLLASVLLNTKLIMLIPFLWVLNRLTILQKSYFVAAMSVVLLYLIPLMYKESFFALNQFKTVFYIWESLALAANITVLNISTIDPGHYNFFYIVISLVILMILSAYSFKKNYGILKIVTAFIIASLLGSLIPYKQVFKTEEYFYYYLPSFYPMVLLSFLLLISFVLSLFKRYGKVLKVAVSFVGIYWLASTVYIQKNFQNVMQEWSYSMASLPQDFNYEETIKLKYARLLIDAGYPDEAVSLIKKTRTKFPLVNWYAMLLEIAAKKGDQDEMEKIYKELSLSKAPFENDEIEEN